MTVQLLATKEPAEENFAWGTGFVILFHEDYYLVTAKHVFFPLSRQADYTLPTFEDSLERVRVFGKADELLHEQLLVNLENQSMLYRSFCPQDDKALDIAVIKLEGISPELRAFALDFAMLATSLEPKGDVVIEGYATKRENLSSVGGSVSSRERQEMLDDGAKYFFIIETEWDLTGMSGSPVLNSTKTEIAGVFVGQNRKIKGLGYVVHATYVRRIINNI